MDHIEKQSRTESMTMSADEFFKVYPKTCAPDDFWGQIKRTVNGVPVSQNQIDMIVEAVTTALSLNGEDMLLDLCCGNGALSTLLFARCRGGLGVDYSEFLIDVANKHFATIDHVYELVEDVVVYLDEEDVPGRFNKAVCYGSFGYLDFEAAKTFLTQLRNRFVNLQKLFIGNLPDRNLVQEFYREKDYVKGIELDNRSPIGIWRTEEEIIELSKQTGWKASITRMESSFYAAMYRYDVTLTPVNG
jgi:cyclopropane fatty-acyl-phospholipid synthase-like methyltransferase